MADAEEDRDLVLPEQDFKYLAGTTDRPWNHFTGRWKAIKPVLGEMLRECGTERPLRIVDLGSCYGFFSLQAAHRHPEADIVAVEGSVGVGNGTVGTLGNTRQILGTGAVQTHLRWIQRLGLTNCFVAPEVWDYNRVSDLVLEGRPICDVMLTLSVVHHIDSISLQQYASAGLSNLDGFIALMGKLLLLSPRHFVELPNRPWITPAYDAYGSQRAILEAAAKASGRQWRFEGPIYSVDWFGQRELWVIEATTPMPSVDLQTCPFPLLYRGEEQDAGPVPENNILGDLGALGPYDDLPDSLGGTLGDLGHPADVDSLAGGALAGGVAGTDGCADPLADLAAAAKPLADFPFPMACPHLGGSLVDPGLMTLAEPCAPANARIGEALNTAPTALLLAHLALREAISEAVGLLGEVRNSGLLQDGGPLPQGAGEPARVPFADAALAPRGRAGGGAAVAGTAANAWRGLPGGDLARAPAPLAQQTALLQPH